MMVVSGIFDVLDLEVLKDTVNDLPSALSRDGHCY